MIALALIEFDSKNEPIQPSLIDALEVGCSHCRNVKAYAPHELIAWEGPFPPPTLPASSGLSIDRQPFAGYLGLAQIGLLAATKADCHILRKNGGAHMRFTGLLMALVCAAALFVPAQEDAELLCNRKSSP